MTRTLLDDVDSVMELDELRPLLAEAQERGFLTVEQIAAALAEVEVTKEQVSELHDHLADQGVDILARPDGRPMTVDARLISETPEVDRAAAKPARKPAVDLTVEPSLDSLRLYLRSIG
ncbi:MAG: polymerase primary sigma factor, partial [Solirubrobacteraceae bacterium]|nr:polymerase primary sigma factor [Solirubrobacteraceae bacterium]